MKKSIAICGQICSGKSSVITELHNIFNWDVIAFGNYVKDMANSMGLSPTREIYQELGQQLFSDLGPTNFLIRVIESHPPKSNIHLFDGVRHISIIESLHLIYRTSVIVYLDAADILRYKRYISRRSIHDSDTSYEEFLRLSYHSIEQGILQIRTVADLKIDGSGTIHEIINEIRIYLEKINFLNSV